MRRKVVRRNGMTFRYFTKLSKQTSTDPDDKSVHAIRNSIHEYALLPKRVGSDTLAISIYIQTNAHSLESETSNATNPKTYLTSSTASARSSSSHAVLRVVQADRNRTVRYDV
jgi:hypothetical protein